MEGVDIPPNIQAAIDRSREMRRELRSRRRRTAAAIAGLSLATAIPLSLSFANFSADDVLEAAVSKAQSLADMLDKRSPGERTAAQLTKNRQARALPKIRVAPSPKPAEVALANILLGPPEPLPVELAAAPVAVSTTPAALAIVSPPGGGSVVIPPGGGGIILPPGGGPGGTNPGTPPIVAPPGDTPPPGDKPPVVTPPGNTPPPDQPPPIVTPPGDTPPGDTTPPDHPTPPPVPEPATWAMMLVGFGLIGWRIRYAPRGKPAAA